MGWCDWNIYFFKHVRFTSYSVFLIHILLDSPTRDWYVSDSSQDMSRLEAEVKNLHAAIDQIQVTLASPDLNRLSLREQLTQRQVNTHIIAS